MKLLNCAVFSSEDREKTRWAVIEKNLNLFPQETTFQNSFTTDIFLLYLRHNNNDGELVFDED